MNFLKRCWQRRWIRGLAWTAVTLVTLYALLCAWANWSGARKWRATQAMLKAEGETLDFRATMNDPIPESENFCAIPLLKDLALVMDNDYNKGAPGENRKRLETMKLPYNRDTGVRPKITNATCGTRTDFKAWADWLRKEGSLPIPLDSGDAARDVLAALSKHDAIVHELAAGLNRPHAQWTPEWKTREVPVFLPSIALPHLSVAQGLNQTLSLRAVAAALTGDVAKAHESALIITRLCHANLNDPFLIGLLVAASGANMLHSTTWELCAAHAGTGEDFAKLESALAALDFHQGALRAARSEMAAMVDTMQGFKTRRSEIPGLFQLFIQSQGGDAGAEAFVSDRIVRGFPVGFFDASAAVLADVEFRHIVKPLKEPGWQPALAASLELDNELGAMKKKFWSHPSYIFAAFVVPTITTINSRAAFSNALVNQATIACALERHRIEKGSYPDSLDAVRLADGKPLPPDPMDGKPMRYRKTADGRYALWSVGFDGKDDGGKRTLNEKNPENTSFGVTTYVGDWVWDFPME